MANKRSTWYLFNLMLRARLHLVCWLLFGVNIFALFWRFRALKRDQAAICHDVVSKISPDLRAWVDGINSRLDYLYRKTSTNDFFVSSVSPVSPTFSELSVDWAFGVDNGSPFVKLSDGLFLYVGDETEFGRILAIDRRVVRCERGLFILDHRLLDRRSEGLNE